MTTFYICRHGESENNNRKRLMGWLDTPLTKQGKENARSSASKLKGNKFNKIVSSDLGRAFMTAYIVSRQIGYISDIHATKDLREVNYGDLANQPYSAYPAAMSVEENAKYIPPNGESLNQMQERVMNYINELGLKFEGRTVLLVAHDGTVNAIRASFSGNNMGAEDATHNEHDFVAKFEWEQGKIKSFEEIK